jgi:hypothetical protein
MEGPMKNGGVDKRSYYGWPTTINLVREFTTASSYFSVMLAQIFVG